IVQEGIGHVLRRPLLPLLAVVGRVKVSEGPSRFVGEARFGFGQPLGQSTQMSLQPFGGPAGTHEAAFPLLDNAFNPFAQASADLRDPRSNFLVERGRELTRRW